MILSRFPYIFPINLHFNYKVTKNSSPKTAKKRALFSFIFSVFFEEKLNMQLDAQITVYFTSQQGGVSIESYSTFKTGILMVLNSNIHQTNLSSSYRDLFKPRQSLCVDRSIPHASEEPRHRYLQLLSRSWQLLTEIYQRLWDVSN